MLTLIGWALVGLMTAAALFSEQLAGAAGFTGTDQEVAEAVSQVLLRTRDV